MSVWLHVAVADAPSFSVQCGFESAHGYRVSLPFTEIYAVKSTLFTAGSSAEKRCFQLTQAAPRRIVLTADVY
jgi:hypothetical protein